MARRIPKRNPRGYVSNRRSDAGRDLTVSPHAVVRRNITEGNSFDVVVSPSMTILCPGFTDRDVAQAWAEQYERTNFR